MNLIANRHLDGAQKQVIYELTLKKRQSKKSTMSDRQRAARQQLAKELMHERKIPHSLGSISSQQTIDSLAISAISSTNSDSMSHDADQQSLFNNEQQQFLLNNSNSNSNNSSPVKPPVANTNSNCQTCCCNQTPNSTKTISSSQQKQQTINTTIVAHLIGSTELAAVDDGAGNTVVPVISGASVSGMSCASCSFTRSDSSYSGVSSASIITSDSNSSSSNNDNNKIRHNAEQSQNNNTQLMIENDGNDDDSDPFKEARKKEASIKVHKLKLEYLNSELDQRLHQYEYLVSQEKALLGTYNLMLFTNQGVNNFHLHRDI